MFKQFNAFRLFCLVVRRSIFKIEDILFLFLYAAALKMWFAHNFINQL